MQVKAETKVGLFVLVSIIIFVFMITRLGVLKFNAKDYQPYIVYFKNIDGIEKKADVKIAGMKVGWVDNIELIQNGNESKIKIMLHSNFKLYSDANAEIQKDGFLGSKYLAINPGINESLILNPGETLAKASKEQSSIYEIMNKFEKIANNIQDVSESLKSTLGKSQENQLKSIIQNIDEASKKIILFTDVISRNENNLDQMFKDLKDFAKEIKPIGKDIHKAADIFDKNFCKLSSTLDSTMQNINSITKKIDNGQGSIGKLLNNDEVYNDLRVVSGSFKNMAQLADNMGIIFDSHFESMGKNAEHYNHPDSKGYLDFRLYTQEDLFYMFQIIGTEKGSVSRLVERNRYFDQCNKELNSDEINKLNCAWDFDPIRTDKIIQKRNTVKYGLQIAKIFKDIALRFGVFENSAGFALDYQVPFCNDNFRWISSFEAWDFRGQNRIDDRRPHLKWLNRVYFLRNIYLDFGADDFISRKNANAFFGFGLRFGDEDLKYLLSKLSFLAGINYKG